MSLSQWVGPAATGNASVVSKFHNVSLHVLRKARHFVCVCQYIFMVMHMKQELLVVQSMTDPHIPAVQACMLSHFKHRSHRV